MPRWVRSIAIGLAVLLAVCILTVAGMLTWQATYADRIYPGAFVRDIDVGHMTIEQATAMLTRRLPDPGAEGIAVRAGDQFWQLSWVDAGKGYDYAATAMSAYQVNRDRPWRERILPIWLMAPQRHTVEPFVVAADPDRVAAIVERVAPLVAVTPTEAQLQIGPGGVIPFSGDPGWALDVEASVMRILQGLEDGAAEVELVLTPVPPRLLKPEPALTQAQMILAEPFILIADDPVTHYYVEFIAPLDRVASWLRAVPEYTSESARMVLEIEEAAVQAWVDQAAPNLGSERLLDTAETLQRAMTALAAGEHQAEGQIQHPEKTYVVQPGDFFFDIAYNHGFPQWRLEEANPDVDPEALDVGMELVIPSIDLLVPEPIVPGKLIEIDLPEQRLLAYEYDQLVYEFTCSSGMSTTPTIAGLFQVLMKEDNAHAPRWHLDMPYFLGIYLEGPDFYNGIHELPITAGGHRLWAGVLGWPASYGCIILNVGDAEELYNWAPVGTLVRITGVAPGTPTYEERVAQEMEDNQQEDQ